MRDCAILEQDSVTGALKPVYDFSHILITGVLPLCHGRILSEAKKMKEKYVWQIVSIFRVEDAGGVTAAIAKAFRALWALPDPQALPARL